MNKRYIRALDVYLRQTDVPWWYVFDLTCVCWRPCWDVAYRRFRAVLRWWIFSPVSSLFTIRINSYTWYAGEKVQCSQYSGHERLRGRIFRIKAVCGPLILLRICGKLVWFDRDSFYRYPEETGRIRYWIN